MAAGAGVPQLHTVLVGEEQGAHMCTCLQLAHKGLPCRHYFAVLLHYPELHFAVQAAHPRWLSGDVVRPQQPPRTMQRQALGAATCTTAAEAAAAAAAVSAAAAANHITGSSQYAQLHRLTIDVLSTRILSKHGDPKGLGRRKHEYVIACLHLEHPSLFDHGGSGGGGAAAAPLASSGSDGGNGGGGSATLEAATAAPGAPTATAAPGAPTAAPLAGGGGAAATAARGAATAAPLASSGGAAAMAAPTAIDGEDDMPLSQLARMRHAAATRAATAGGAGVDGGGGGGGGGSGGGSNGDTAAAAAHGGGGEEEAPRTSAHTAFELSLMLLVAFDINNSSADAACLHAIQARKEAERRQIYADSLSYCKLMCSHLADYGSTPEAARVIDTFRTLVGKVVSDGAAPGPDAVRIGNMVPNVRVSGKALGKRATSAVEGKGRRKQARTVSASGGASVG
jgi:hypothetical protein